MYCNFNFCRMRESDFPCAYKERYDSPGVFGPAKLRKLKSMQPKTDEEFDLAFKAKMKRAKMREERKAKKAESSAKAAAAAASPTFKVLESDTTDAAMTPPQPVAANRHKKSGLEEVLHVS